MGSLEDSIISLIEIPNETHWITVHLIASHDLSAPLIQWQPVASVCVCEWDTTTFISNWFSLYLSVCLPPSALSLGILLPGDHILIEYTPLSVSVCACVVEWMSDLTDGSLRGECKGVVEQLSQLYRAVPGPDCLRVRSGFQFTTAIPPDRLWAIVLPRIIIASVYNLLSIVSSVSGFCPLECVCWKSSPFEGCRVSQQVRRLPMNGT